MKMFKNKIEVYEKISVSQEIESLSPEEIKWNEPMMVDPRDYKIHPLNARLEKPMRDSKGLEDSILEIGYRFALTSDENKMIIDGGRRHNLALKHNLKIPVIHKIYGKGWDASIHRGIDSLIGNRYEPNFPTEIGELANILIQEYGASIGDLSRRLGIAQTQLNQMCSVSKAPKDLFPEDDTEVEEKWKLLTHRKRKTLKRIIENTDATPQERARQFKIYAELPFPDLDAVSRDIGEGEVIDVDERHRLGTMKKRSHWECTTDLDDWKRVKSKIRVRRWDKQNTINCLLRYWGHGVIELSQEMYDSMKTGEVIGLEDSD